MARGGYRPGAGRKSTAGAGAARKEEPQAPPLCLERVDPASAPFRTAEEYLMALVNCGEASPKDRLAAAVALLPYQLPKMGEQGMGKKEQQAEAAQRRATGKYAPPPPPGSSALN